MTDRMYRKINDKQIEAINRHVKQIKELLTDVSDTEGSAGENKFPAGFPGFYASVQVVDEEIEILDQFGNFKAYFNNQSEFDSDYLKSIMKGDDWPIFLQNITLSIEHKKITRNDYRFILNDNKKWFEIIIFPKGKNQVELIFIENTNRKNAEEQERDLLELDKNASLKSLVSSIAHEINNPNHNIMQNISLLEDGWDDIIAALDEYAEIEGDFNIKNVKYSKVRDYLSVLMSKILKSSRQIKELLDDLRNFSQKSQDYMSDQVNLNYLVEKTINLIKQPIQNATENFKIMYSTNMVTVLGNFNQLQQVLLNLIYNSINALETHSQEIKVFTFYNKEEKFVGIGVSDQGKGIEQEKMNNIFNHFYNIKSGGSGLGLPVSKEIIDKHNGKIKIKPNFGKGTTVTFQLPVKNGRH